MSIGFNTKLLDSIVNALALVGTTKVRIDLIDEGSPAVFQADEESSTDRAILMPMRI